MKSQTEGVCIRNATESDAGGILKAQVSAFEKYLTFVKADMFPPMCETVELMKEVIARTTVLVAGCESGFIAGSIRYSVEAGVCFFERLSVHPLYQGRGIGSQLVREVEGRADGKAHKVFLETGLLAEGLLMFYARLGYSGEAVLRNHYGAYDWIMMSKFL